MNKNLLIMVIVLAILGIGGGLWYANQKIQQTKIQDKSMMQQKGGWTRQQMEEMEKEKSSTMKDEKHMMTGYQGAVLAGKSSPYLDFKKADYDKALKDGKIILLDFYANWCPICRAEAPELKAGFDSLPSDKVVGFRVNWQDSDTDADEKALASQFGITSQHTKIILKNGKEIGRTLEQWDKATFLQTINDAINK